MKSHLSSGFFAFLFLLFTTTTMAQTNIDSSITYIHSEKASFTSKLVQSMASLLGIKKGGMFKKALNKRGLNDVPVPVPKAMLKKYHVQESTVHNRKVWTLKPRENASEKVVLYLHGGAYLLTIRKYHWQFAEDLMLRTNATIVVPDYPLAPGSNCKAAMAFLAQVYQDLLAKHAPENIAFSGDSSGGGLALGFAMTLKQEHKPQPGQIILLYPWLDVSMSNEDIAEADNKDKILGIEPLQIAGKAFAGELDWKDYRVSPIYGDLSGLGKISVFIGTHDLFIADCRKLKRLAEESNNPINYFEYPKMFHGWVVPKGMKEAKVARGQIFDLIKNGRLIMNN
jgi:acetyl esterase/lipase